MKQRLPMACRIISALLFTAFVIKSIADYLQYTKTMNSAPFYLFVLANALYLLIPAFIVMMIGRIARR